MGRSLIITVNLLGAILGFGCNAPRVTSVGSIEPDANQSLQPMQQNPLGKCPIIHRGFRVPSEPDSSAGRAKLEEAALLHNFRSSHRLNQDHTIAASRSTVGGGRTGRGFGSLRRDFVEQPGANRGVCWVGQYPRATRKPWAAERSWRRVVELQPDNAQAILRHGNVLHQIGRTKEAERSWIRCLTLAPDDAEPLIQLAMLELERNQPEAALPYARRAFVWTPKCQSSDGVCQVLLGVGQPTASIPHWNMAIEARPEDFSLLAGLLEAYAQCQDYEGAWPQHWS